MALAPSRKVNTAELLAIETLAKRDCQGADLSIPPSTTTSSAAAGGSSYLEGKPQSKLKLARRCGGIDGSETRGAGIHTGIAPIRMVEDIE